MSWDVTKLSGRPTVADVKTIKAYNCGEPLPPLPKPRWGGPSSPERSGYFYETLGYTRGRPSGVRSYLPGQARYSDELLGCSLTVPPQQIKALWGDSVWVEGRGWVDLREILKIARFTALDEYGARV